MGNIFSTLFGGQIVNSKVEEKEIEELPIEVQFKILQYLNYEELFNMKQTNHYFYELINKHKNVLARKRFKYLFFVQTLVTEMLCTEHSLRERDLVKQNIESIDFALKRRRQKKWISALKRKISVLLTNNTSEFGNIMLMGSTIIFNDKETFEKELLFVKLPIIPQNIKELKIVRFWVEQIFSCVYGFVKFTDFMFNPAMFNLLFYNDEIEKLKLYCNRAEISFHNQNIEAWKFNVNRLVINKTLVINFEKSNPTEEDNNFLFKFFANIGLVLSQPKENQIIIYNNFVDHIATAKNVTKVSCIQFRCENWPRSQLIVKGEEVKPYNNIKKYFEITNIHDSKMVFSILWLLNEDDNNLLKFIQIIYFTEFRDMFDLIDSLKKN
ncbi:F-box domain-containing protein [Meloidogyne graminicola]|uniref:F-box domain-containing protein n=1 Tax=Meloidogyne graminicola TaxID=189291 RepID=A0A8S9ZT69_9BILA|nr:F-box domain-containing protein [Meloidogyne graminicola]